MSRLCLYSCRITNVYDILFVTCSVVRLFITWEIKLTFVDQRGNYLFFLFENRKYRSQFIPPPSISLFLSSDVLLNLLDSQLLCFATPQRFTVEIYFFSGALREIPKRLEPVGLCHTLYVIISYLLISMATIGLILPRPLLSQQTAIVDNGDMESDSFGEEKLIFVDDCEH